jgi:ABC-type glycerol-3-phosphate transport system substrate-binding protein
LKTAGIGSLALGAACTPAATPAPGQPAATSAPAERTALRYLNQGGVFADKEDAPLSKLIREWEELHPNLTMNIENYGFDDGHDKYATILRAGEVVDLAYGQAEWMPEFAELGALEPMEKWVDPAVIEDMFEGARN